MAIFYICRHGETENNKSRRLSGWIDSPLTPDGLKPTEKVIAKLRNINIDAVYSSDLGRAFITAYVVVRGLGLDKEIIRLPGLREVNYGDASNMPKSEAYPKFPGIDSVTTYTPPNGESLARMQERVITTVSQLNDELGDATVLLVAHSGVMAALHASCNGNDFGSHNVSEAYDHDFVARCIVQNGKVISFEEVR